MFSHPLLQHQPKYAPQKVFSASQYFFDRLATNPRNLYQWSCCLLMFVSIFMVTACGGGSAQADETAEQFQIREARATFTPTAPSPQSQEQGNANTDQADSNESDPNSAPAQEGQQDTSQADTQSADGPSATVPDTQSANEPGTTGAAADPNFAGTQAIVRSALVNGRSGPGTNFEVVGIVEEGRIFDVISQNESGEWWQVCCYDDQRFWVINDLIEILSANSAQPAAASQPAAAPANPTPIPTAVPADTEAAPTAEQSEATGESAFELVIQEQFPETNVVRVFAYVFSDQVQALEGYAIKVTKDGADISPGVKSFGPQAGFTWPIATTRQRFQNLKAEFPGQSPAGTWVIQLIDGGGQPVGSAATFDLTGGDPNQELYVRYKQN